MPQDSDLFPHWLARSKVAPIVQQVDILSRPSLKARLNKSLRGSLTLVSAPAGYGKSTVLADWCRTLPHSGVEEIAWLSLEDDDNDPFQLVLYMAYALSVAGVAIADAGIDGKSVFGNLSVRHFLNVVHTAVERHQGKVVLILDDFEHLGDHAVSTVVEPFIRYAPPNLHIAIASRRDGPLKIADLELRGLAHRLGAEELKFSVDDLVEFLSPEIDARSIREIHAITEGWPVAIQLLRTAAKAERDLSRILSKLVAGESRMAAYLSEQVFDDLDEETQAFLIDISIVGRIDPEFSDFLRQRDNSAEMLAGLKDLDALVTPVDREGRAYRMHPMFRDYLHRMLTGAHPARASALNVRAGRWFARQGELIKAVRHSVNGNDPEGARDYIESAGGLMLWLKEGLSRLPRALALLDDLTIRSNPRLALIRCMLLLKTGRCFEARDLYESTMRKLPDGAGEDRSLAYESTIIQQLLHAYEGQEPSDELFDSLEKTAAGIPSTNRTLLGHHHTMLCGLNSFVGRLRRARHHARLAIGHFRSVTSIYGETYIHMHLGDVSYCEGLTGEAEEHYKTALRLIRRHFNDDRAIKLIVDVLQAELKYDANRLDQIPRAAELFPRQLHKLEAWFNIYAAAYVVCSNVVFSRHGLSPATAILDLQQEFAETRRQAGLRNLIASQRAALLQRAGRDADAASVLAESGLSLEGYLDGVGRNVGWRERNIAVQTLLRMMIRQQDPCEAIHHLDSLLKSGKEGDGGRFRIANHLLRASAYCALAEEDRMLADLGRALELASECGAVRAFVDEGDGLAQLLDAFIDRAGNAPGDASRVEFARTVRGQFSGLESSKPCLTERELQVLRQLENGYPNKVIARNIGISHNTVRYHLKNVFAKLNVDTRTQAVSAARRSKVLNAS